MRQIFLVALFSRSIVKVLHNVQAFQMLLMLETNLARVFFIVNVNRIRPPCIIHHLFKNSTWCTYAFLVLQGVVTISNDD
jgi:hypothetical protein